MWTPFKKTRNRVNHVVHNVDMMAARVRDASRSVSESAGQLAGQGAALRTVLSEEANLTGTAARSVAYRAERSIDTIETAVLILIAITAACTVALTVRDLLAPPAGGTISPRVKPVPVVK